MSYEAELKCYDYFQDNLEMAQALLSFDLRLSNHSYGAETGWRIENGVW